VITEYPVLRTTNKKGIKINYISTRQLPPDSLIEKRKTETGYINVSKPMLTALDLVTYEKKIGGLTRASTVINELLETVNQKDIRHELVSYARITSLQRLGFILDEIVDRNDLAEKIYTQCKKAGLDFYMIPLKASGDKKKSIVNDKWKLIINTEIELDE
jgi:hypothetical protein